MATAHTCHVDCTPGTRIHGVTGEPYTYHDMFAAEPSSAAGRYQWEQNAAIKRQGRRAWRATGQGESREVRIWNARRREGTNRIGQRSFRRALGGF